MPDRILIRFSAAPMHSVTTERVEGVRAGDAGRGRQVEAPRRRRPVPLIDHDDGVRDVDVPPGAAQRVGDGDAVHPGPHD